MNDLACSEASFEIEHNLPCHWSLDEVSLPLRKAWFRCTLGRERGLWSWLWRKISPQEAVLVLARESGSTRLIVLWCCNCNYVMGTRCYELSALIDNILSMVCPLPEWSTHWTESVWLAGLVWTLGLSYRELEACSQVEDTAKDSSEAK